MGSSARYTYDAMDNLTSVTDYLGRTTAYTYDTGGNLTSVTDAAGRTETMAYDTASRIVSYTANGGSRITYDYDKLDDLVQKSYTGADGKQSAEDVTYAYDPLGQRVAMYDSTGDTEYTYDGLGRITSVTTYRTENEDGTANHAEASADTVRYSYDEAGNLSAITYPDGTQASYEYDLNDNLTKVTDREGKETAYVYDAINRITEIHRPNGISTYNTYDAADRITELANICDGCEWVVSRYSYTYDERGFIVSEKAEESLAGYAYDDKHSGKHTDGRHDDLYPHGNKHAKHDRDAAFAYQIIETDRTFTYDDAGKLLSCTETEDNYGTYVYTYEYDLMGNRTAVTKTAEDGTVAEWEKYEYNESSQLTAEELYNGKKTTKLAYAYDADGNLISETGKTGTDKVEKSYEYDVENRLAAVYDADELLMAAAYDGDGNRVFQLNCNLHTDEDWKGNSGNGNGNNKDNKGSGNNGKGNNSSKGNTGSNGNNGNGKGKGNSKSSGTDDAGYGNATNAGENNSQNQSGILFPIDGEVSETEQSLINKIKTTGREKNYELIEYLNDVNREYTEVLVEQNINGRLDTAYVYGSANSTGGRLSLDRFDGSRGYYLYDPKGNVTGITNEEGQVYQSYRYGSFGEITFGAPQYENEYTYNGESYNPNIESQYLRARYYNVVHADFLTEDSYLGNIYEPLTLNRYNYCVSNPVNHRDPSGNDPINAPWAGLDILYWLTGDETYREQADEMRAAQQELEYYEGSTAAGIAVGMYEPVQPVVQFCENPILAILSQLASLSDIDTGLAPKGTTYIDEKVCQVYDSNSYYIGKCAGNIGTEVILSIATDGTVRKTVNGPKVITIFPAKNRSMEFALEGGGTIYEEVLEEGIKIVIPGEVIVGVTDAGVTSGLLYQSNLNVNASKVDWDSLVSGSEGGSGFKGDSETDIPDYKKENRVPLDKETVLNGNEYQKTGKKVKGAQVYKNGNQYYYRDTFHTGESAHIEVFDKWGNHLGEADPLTGVLKPGTADPTKTINVK